MSPQPSDIQIAKARYDEANQILDAWNHRRSQAQAANYNANRNGGNAIETRRNLNAIEIQCEDAKELAQQARKQWIAAVHEKQEHSPRKRVAA